MNRIVRVAFMVSTCLTVLTTPLFAQPESGNPRDAGVESMSVPDEQQDRAGRIVRGAIASAPYHLNRLSEYSADVYLKSSYDVVKISGLVRNLSGRTLEAFRDGDNYVQESVSEVDFTAPNKYRQRIVRRIDDMPKGLKGFEEGAMRLLNINAYDPDTFPAIISPLSPGAFSHYRFRYEGSVEEDGEEVGKIRVTPIYKSQQLVSGHILISEHDWSVRGLDLTGRMDIMARIGFRLQSDYDRVADDIWLPTERRVSFDARLITSEAAVRFTAVAKYGSLTVDAAVGIPAAVRAASDSLQGGFSNREAYHTARLTARKIEASRQTSLDITGEFTDDLKVTVDSLADSVDSLFWDNARPVALENFELEGYRKRGTTSTTPSVARRNRGRSFVSKLLNGRKTVVGRLFSGGDPLRLGERGGELRWHGAVPHKSGFNTVDGFYLGIAPVTYSKTFSGGRGLSYLTIRPEVAWAIDRHVAMGNLDVNLLYAPMRRGLLDIRVGSISRDFSSSAGGILPFDNTLASLLFRRSYLKLYEDNFIEVDNTIDLTNGLALSLSLKYSRREGLENTSDFSFFNREKRVFTPNIHMADHTAARFTVGVEFTPDQYYRVTDRGRKQMVRSRWPTLFLAWEKGVKGPGGSTVDFDHISGGVRQDIQLGNAMHRLEYLVLGGVFTNKKSLYFPDYRHLNAIDIPITNSSITSVGSFRMLPSYIYSTPDRYLEMHVSYRARFLLLKLLPWVRGRLWHEGVQFHYLDIPALRNHVEIDYTVSHIWQAGFFIGFDNFKYSRAGVRFSIPLRVFYKPREHFPVF